MNKIVISLFALLLIVACKNDPAVDAAFSKYSMRSGVVSITIPGFAIKAVANLADLQPEEKELLRNIDKVKVLTIDDSENFEGVNFHKEFGHLINENSYTELLSIKDQNDQIKILAKMIDKEHIQDLIILVGGEDNALIYLKGNITLDQISNVANGANGIGSLRELAKIN